MPVCVSNEQLMAQNTSHRVSKIQNIMLTESMILSSKTATSTKNVEEDLGVLIYRESQLRKAEAAAAIAAESKKTSSCASPRRTTSTRKRTVVKR